jgi:FAD dependent oxidoreductase
MKAGRQFVWAFLGCALSVVSLRGAEPGKQGDATQGKRTDADLIVYGGTASGVMTAYSAAREGLRVVLLEPGAHLGGMVTGGLSATDIGHSAIIGGYARAFYMKAAAHYGANDLERGKNWLSEPHVDEEIFDDMLRITDVKVRFHERLREKNGVEMQGGRVTALTTEDGKRWRAVVFADCSYEGELMAQSHVSYTWGRESEKEYDEDLAGVREHTPGHQFGWAMSPYDTQHHLLPEVDAGPLAPAGSGDKKVQAYNFRLILTNDAANRLPFPKPDGYDRARFALLEQYLGEFEEHVGRAPRVQDLFLPVLIRNHKADFNNNGPISTDYIGHSWSYPEASYAEKAKIWREHLLYTESLMYFLSHDASVPETLREELKEWGLPKDEFADTDHWPRQLYIREGRRMVGAYVMRQSDLQTERTKSDSIGMGSYNSDSHNIERVAMPDGSVQNEGNVEVPVEPYEIAYRSITPKREQVQNLLVPVCLSASHAAYSSVRMEPQYMIIGQAAGAAAALALQRHSAVQDVPIAMLQKKLQARGAVLHLGDEVMPEWQQQDARKF